MDQHPRVARSDPNRVAELELSSSRSRVVVIDVERCLLRTSAVRQLLGVLLRSGSLSLARWMRERRVARRAAAGKCEASIRYLRGVSSDDAARLMVELAPDLARRAEPAAVRLIDRHVQGGDFVVLVSDAPVPLVRALAAEVGAHRGVGVVAAPDGSISVATAGSARTGALETALGADALRSAILVRNRLS